MSTPSCPGLLNTPLMQPRPDNGKAALAESVPFPTPHGRPPEYAHLVETMIFNGQSVRLDGPNHMAPG